MSVLGICLCFRHIYALNLSRLVRWKKGGLVVLLNGISSNVNGTRMMVTLNDVVTTCAVGDCSNALSSGRKHQCKLFLARSTNKKQKVVYSLVQKVVTRMNVPRMKASAQVVKTSVTVS